MRMISVILLCSALAGCGDDEPAKMNHYMAVAIAEELLGPRLKDPESAIYSSITYKDETDERPIIVCGLVNSRNSFGGMIGNQRFIIGGAVMIEEQFTAEQMDIAWQEFCR